VIALRPEKINHIFNKPHLISSSQLTIFPYEKPALPHCARTIVLLYLLGLRVAQVSVSVAVSVRLRRRVKGSWSAGQFSV